MNADPLLDFCTDLASSAPDLPPEDDTKNSRKRPTEVVDEKRAEKRASRGSKQSQAKGRSMAVNQAGTKLKTEAPGTELKDEDEDADDTAPKLEQEEQELVTKNEITKHESIAAVDLEAPVALVDFAPGKEAEDEDYDA